MSTDGRSRLWANPSDDELRELLAGAWTIAVVGLSRNPAKASFHVASYLQQKGYRIIPVNPSRGEILGESVYANLDEVPEPVDIVDVFRRPEDVPPVVAAAVRNKARFLWLQEGIVNDEAAVTARQHGLGVVMDRCIMKEHRRLISRG